MAQPALARIDRKAIEARLTFELKQARESYDACTERYKSIVGDHEERKGEQDPHIGVVMSAQLQATVRYSVALDKFNRFLLEGEFPP